MLCYSYHFELCTPDVLNRSQGQQIIAQIFHSNTLMTVLCMSLSLILFYVYTVSNTKPILSSRTSVEGFGIHRTAKSIRVHNDASTQL